MKAEQDKIVELQSYDLSNFVGQCYYKNDESQNYLMFQPIYKTITTFSGLTSIISEWESKGLSNAKFNSLYTINKILSPKKAWMNNSRMRLGFQGSYLKQDDKASFSPDNVVTTYCLWII